MIYFSKKLAKTAADLRNMEAQMATLDGIRANAEQLNPTMNSMFKLIAENDRNFKNSEIAKAVLSANAARTPADAYREFDTVSKLEPTKQGEFATLERLFDVAKSVNVGKSLYEYRRVSESGIAQTSASGRKDIIIDHSSATYGGAIVPIHDTAFGRHWRDVEAMRADGYDALVDDAVGAEKVLRRKMVDFLFDGNTNVVINGVTWTGLRNDTASVIQFTLTADLTSALTTAEAIRAQFVAIRDALKITNDVDGDIKIGLSREIMSNLERPFSTSDGTFGTIYDYVMKLRGISEIYEDSELTGNEVLAAAYGLDAFHSVIGMPISTYALPRTMHNSDFNFVKWAAVGFNAKTSFSGKKSVLFGN